ncbi:MAG: energy transducer TonB [Bacteroidetes bacterium]|nr:energy transducer TonB [Bacteroidota bacterium]
MKREEILRADMLDILFEGRNKAYGAYDLRKRYPKFVARAILITVVLTVAILSYSFIKNKLAGFFPDKPIEVEANITNLEAPPPMEENEPPPPEQTAPPPPPEKASVQYVPPVVKEVVAQEVEMTTVKDLKDKDPGTKTFEGDPNATDNINPLNDAPPGLFESTEKKVVAKVEDENKIFTVVEQQPEFPGGTGAMYKWIGENLKYPSEARNNGLQGKVILQFTVEKNGDIANVKVVRDAVGGGAGDEAMRVVKKMPNWKPGKQNGKSVRVQFTLPVTFKLEGE